MLAASARSFQSTDPLSGLFVGDHDEPQADQGWTVVDVKAASVNHHDLWSLQGVGLSADNLPMILGTDAAGITADGREVIVHAVIGDPGVREDETFDPKRSLFSEIHNGTFAEKVAVPTRNLVPKPPGLTWEEAACLPTAWLTAYRMLTRDSGLAKGDTVLVQGAGGGVSTALVVLGKALGMRVWVTSRDASKRQRSVELGADDAFESGTKLPEKVDAVMETVGKATWAHSLRSLRPGGTVVVSGATSGDDPSADLKRVFFLQLRVIGSTMGSLGELAALVELVSSKSIHPLIDSVFPLSEAKGALGRMANGELFGKIVLVT
ncbi:MAG TPA: zinc-binding dehydrogenase [Acidimicrobiales bacterium]|nr:zinc-binding dehydrogenase [Acidimicrobiales bacterium]